MKKLAELSSAEVVAVTVSAEAGAAPELALSFLPAMLFRPFRVVAPSITTATTAAVAAQPFHGVRERFLAEKGTVLSGSSCMGSA